MFRLGNLQTYCCDNTSKNDLELNRPLELGGIFRNAFILLDRLFRHKFNALWPNAVLMLKNLFHGDIKLSVEHLHFKIQFLFFLFGINVKYFFLENRHRRIVAKIRLVHNQVLIEVHTSWHQFKIFHVIIGPHSILCLEWNGISILCK